MHTLASWHSFIFNFSGRTGWDSNTSDKGRILGVQSFDMLVGGATCTYQPIWESVCHIQHNMASIEMSCGPSHCPQCHPPWSCHCPPLYHPLCQCCLFQMPCCHLFQDSGTCCLFFMLNDHQFVIKDKITEDQIPFNHGSSSSLAESELLPLGSIDGGTPGFGCKYFGNENMLWSSTNLSLTVPFQEPFLWVHGQALEAWWLLQHTRWDW